MWELVFKMGVCGRADERLNMKSKWTGERKNEWVTSDKNYNASDEKEKEETTWTRHEQVWTHGCF